MGQGSLFDMMAPPPKPTPKEPEPLLSPEEIFYRRLYERPTTRVYLCIYCEKPYYSISYHLLKVCAADWDGPKEETKEATSPLPQPETPERSDNFPGEYAYKGPGVEKGETMSPHYRPPPKEEEASQGPALKVEQAPHWWHWVRQSTTMRGHERFTPSPAMRRRSIPSIACSLFYAAWACYYSKDMADNAPSGYVKTNDLFYSIDQRKVERLKELLVFCGVDELCINRLTSEAWKSAKACVWVTWKSVAPRLLKHLGYELQPNEDDGWFDTMGASFAEFANKEGIKGR